MARISPGQIEYGELNHLFVNAELFMKGSTLCGLHTEVTCPPNPIGKDCASCNKLRSPHDEFTPVTHG